MKNIVIFLIITSLNYSFDAIIKIDNDHIDGNIYSPEVKLIIESNENVLGIQFNEWGQTQKHCTRSTCAHVKLFGMLLWFVCETS